MAVRKASQALAGEDRPPVHAGRPRITDWKQHVWWGRISHADFDEAECWVPDGGHNSIKTNYGGRLITVRRYLFTRVRVEELGEPELVWDDVLMSSASCISTDCVNPAHMFRTDRTEAGRIRMAELAASRPKRVAVRPVVSGSELRAETRGLSPSDLSQLRTAYLRMRLRLIGTGLLDDTGVDMDYVDELRAWATATYPKLMKEAVDYVLGEPAKSTPKRDTAVDTLLATYPDLAAL